MGERLFRRGDIWYTHVFEEGRRRQISTHRRDKQAGREVARQLDRDAADPKAAKMREATLGEALALFLENRRGEAKAGKLSGETVTFYERKAGHLARLFEHDGQESRRPFRLARLGAEDVDDYIARRRGEDVADHTIKKELVTLRGALKLAKRRGLWRGDLDAVMPERFSPGYKPRERALTVPELQKLLAQLRDDRAARVAFVVATSAEWAVTERALREDVDLERMQVFLRGSKRRTRRRTVPVVYPPQQSLLRYALGHAEGTEGALFTRWGNARRDLRAACRRAGIAACCFNDLRRTAATWLRAAGVPLELLAPITGHSSTRMLEQVYARLRTEDLGRRVAVSLGLIDAATAADCAAFSSET